MSKKRKSASQLVEDAMPWKAKTWYEELSRDDQAYVGEVIQAIIQGPGVAVFLVARNLIVTLPIKRSAETVARTLREMIRNEEARCKKTR